MLHVGCCTYNSITVDTMIKVDTYSKWSPPHHLRTRKDISIIQEISHSDYDDLALGDVSVTGKIVVFNWVYAYPSCLFCTKKFDVTRPDCQNRSCTKIVQIPFQDFVCEFVIQSNDDSYHNFTIWKRRLPQNTVPDSLSESTVIENYLNQNLQGKRIKVSFTPRKKSDENEILNDFYII